MAYKKMRPRKKVCNFCKNKEERIDYKNVELMKHYISLNGKISPRRSTGTCARHQREVQNAIKNARFMALLPYTVE